MNGVVEYFVNCFVQLAVVYYGGGAILQFLAPAVFPVQNLQSGTRPNGQMLRDAKRSLGPLAVKSAIWCVVREMHRHSISLLYTAHAWTPSEILYGVAVVLVMDLLHDAWFYWTHRLLHQKMLYKYIHYLHHQSKMPSAFSGYSFHVVEALIVFANEILICFVLPIDLGLHRNYHLLTTLIHQGGHVGYEVSPYLPMAMNAVLHVATPKWLRLQLTKTWLNTVQHHDMHHTHIVYHFSLYFTHWDRLQNTLHPSYDKICEMQS